MQTVSIRKKKKKYLGVFSSCPYIPFRKWVRGSSAAPISTSNMERPDLPWNPESSSSHLTKYQHREDRNKMKRKSADTSSDNTCGRRQPQTSCDSCRRKKLKCDRGEPCSNCSVRGLTCGRQSISSIVESEKPR